MNIHDLPIPNFGELNDEAALKLILEVRLRRRLLSKNVAKKQQPTKSTAPKNSVKKKEPLFNTPFGKLTKAELLELMANLKSNG